MSATAERDDVVGTWLSLPRRIYLDTSTLQKLYDFGGEIFEGEVAIQPELSMVRSVLAGEGWIVTRSRPGVSS